MSDNLRRYCARRDALRQGYPGQPTGPVARPVTPLAALLRGLVGSQSTPLPPIASQVPARTKPESRVKRFARWMQNDPGTEEGYVVPYAERLRAHLALQTLVLVIDGSVGGRRCVALMIHVGYKGRALPLAWVVRRGKQGHLPADLPITLVTQVHTLLPLGASVVLLGAGECDGPTLQQPLQDAHWSYVVRTGSNLTVRGDGERFRCKPVAACRKPGTLVALTHVRVTAAAYGPVMRLCCWAKGSQEPLYLLTHRASADEACRLDATRFRIATFVVDQTSRGCSLPQAHLSDPTRLARLLIAACSASIWLMSLGARGEPDGWISIIHRGARCDRSLFQLGLRLLAYLLNADRAIPVAFSVTL